MQAAAFIIHLERAVSRKPQVDWLKSNLPIAAEILPAVDGAKLTAAEKKSVYQRHIHRPHYPFALRDAEIGCFLSHRLAWQKIVNYDLDFGFVIEDDINIDLNTFQQAFELVAKASAPGTYTRFPWRFGETGPVVAQGTSDCRVTLADRPGLGMLGQIVTRAAAEKLLAVTEFFDRPVDTTLQLTWITGVKLQSVWPNGLNEISDKLSGSTIGDKKGLLEKVHREISRPIYRTKVELHRRLRFHRTPNNPIE